MSVKERLILFTKSQRITNTEFCKTIGVSNAFISSMRKSLQPDKIESIALNYSQLNINWLLTGEGSMLKGNQNSNNYTPEMKENEQLLAQLRDEVNEQRENVKYFKEMCRKMQEEIERLTLLITGNPENKKKEAI